MPTYPELVYRGTFQCEVGADYSGSLLTADQGGGLLASEIVFPGLLLVSLNYSTLHRRVKVRLPTGESVSRLDYIWWFFRNSKDGANAPFLMRSPLDERLFLWRFPDDRLTLSLVDFYLATTGLQLQQAIVTGVTLNDDGSIPEGVTYPDSL